jgi:hypothetical protein
MTWVKRISPDGKRRVFDLLGTMVAPPANRAYAISP